MTSAINSFLLGLRFAMQQSCFVLWVDTLVLMLMFVSYVVDVICDVRFIVSRVSPFFVSDV